MLEAKAKANKNAITADQGKFFAIILIIVLSGGNPQQSQDIENRNLSKRQPIAQFMGHPILLTEFSGGSPSPTKKLMSTGKKSALSKQLADIREQFEVSSNSVSSSISGSVLESQNERRPSPVPLSDLLSAMGKRRYSPADPSPSLLPSNSSSKRESPRPKRIENKGGVMLSDLYEPTPERRRETYNPKVLDFLATPNAISSRPPRV